MNYFYQLVLQSFFCIFLTMFVEWSFAAPAQIAKGEYQLAGPVKKSLLVYKNKAGNWHTYDVDGNVVYKDAKCFNNTCLIIGGSDSSPFLMRTFNQGEFWTTQRNIFNLPENSHGLDANFNCWENDCVAVGGYSLNNSSNSYPLLMTSANQGLTWAQSVVTNKPHELVTASLSHLSCYEKICTAIGYSNLGPFILTSQDKGQSWRYSDLKKFVGSKKTFLEAVRCSDQACVAAGTYTLDYINTHLALFVSQDKGQTWDMINEFPELSHAKNLILEDFIVHNNSFILIGTFSNRKVGGDEALILIGNREGASWHLINEISDSDPSFRKAGWLKSITCTGTTCIAVGYEQFVSDNGYFYLTFIKSEDSGKTWTRIKNIRGDGTVTHIPDLHKVYCDQDQCVVFGAFTDNLNYSIPVMLTSQDRGKSWFGTAKINQFPSHIYNIKFEGIS